MKEKNSYFKITIFFFGVLLLSLNYNLFLAPNQLVIGGISGLAIILNDLFNIPTTIFIYISSLLLIILSYIFLSKKDTKKNLIGSLLYPILISLTEPLAISLRPYFEFDSLLIVAIISGIIYGIADGLIYKAGYTTGGSDVLMKITNKYAKIPEGKASFIINLVIMLFAAVIFGANKFAYSLIILYLSTKMVDRILIGISNSKLFLIYTKELESVQNFIINDFETGVTILEAKGGYSNKESNVIMCAVPTNHYYSFKEQILSIDKDAFFVINDCYEVSGGVKRKNYPFI